ncbi:MAG: acyl-CoA dehydratase activase [Desulfobacterales bacterium]|jgi:predicted CoA-substrate-specific enzyme activase|nr:acyl-CoA dehydratase activase [Desulfobacterales bacterium]
MKVLGICLGASTVTAVSLKGSTARPCIIEHHVRPHDGNPRQTLLDVLGPIDIEAFDRIAVTGRKFRHYVNLTTIAEPEAVEQAYAFVKPPDCRCQAIVSAGGETFMVYVLDARGRIGNVITGNKCASGTGEFFLQQLRRMNVTLEEAARWAVDEVPYPVSGRCSVFCKSDCTHATNKGVPKSRVTAGLCKMMAEKILELLRRVPRRDIMIVGGASRNRMMIAHLQQAIENLMVPAEAPYFEALGAALWALDHETRPWPGLAALLHGETSAFDRLPPLKEAAGLVTFRSLRRDRVRDGDRCILGLDVGSTTTKAILLRWQDKALCADVYLRTNGDPVGASRRCYRAILEQMATQADPGTVAIVGLGVCGSGRQIAGLHAMTEGIINEIIAHATAAVHFDPLVDTLFEIGGQDAKYTFITNGVPSDYAMNEACSAGTGSFLEESAKETLGIEMTDIADIALAGTNPPNFNDQCAAFIASDIKNAVHEGLSRDNIVAGLVYSICMNYTNRVKGNRPVGQRVFMQGGVCYNRAVPMAMATLTGKPIVVPPEPGLMGAFGVALAVGQRIEAGLMAETRFDLERLRDREVSYGRSFVCKGGREGCDRRCTIHRVNIEGKSYPFGGACNRYENLRRRVHHDRSRLDWIDRRQRLVFETFAPETGTPNPPWRGRVGVNRSFFIHSLYPFYAHFFHQLGFQPVLAQRLSVEGIDRRNAPFCYPAELAHGYFHGLISDTTDLDAIFLPHLKSVPALDANNSSQLCPLSQGESFYLRSTFREELNARSLRVLAPCLEMARGLQTARAPMVQMAAELGIDRREANRALDVAIERQQACMEAIKALGREFLAGLEEAPDRPAVILFGRPYNAFAPEAHMGIPAKLASRGVPVLPFDALPLADQEGKSHMYWGTGEQILRGARLVATHPRLYGTFITNFSCGPDSFIVGYFRSIMRTKPSLTLELDSHTADAGIDTRIEAFLDIVTAHRQLANQGRRPTGAPREFQSARITEKSGRMAVTRSDGSVIDATDPRVTLLFPSMGRLGSEALAAVFRGFGFNALAHAPADEAVLKLGRGNTSCKECLPLILTTGTLLHYLQNDRHPDETVVYFMPTGSGPCRFGQYRVFMQDLIDRLRLPDVAILSLTSDDAYAEMPRTFTRQAWWAVIVSDEMENRRSWILANAVDREAALEVFEACWNRLCDALEKEKRAGLETVLNQTAAALKAIPMRRPPDEVPVVGLTGEIFVRRDGLSRRFITERLADLGFATICAPVSEWIHYTNYLVEHGLDSANLSVWQKLRLRLRNQVMRRDEKRIQQVIAGNGRPPAEPVDIGRTLAHAAPYISPRLTGEAGLTVGSAIGEIVDQVCGVIAIGPFGCMPNRLSEALLTEAMTREGKLNANGNPRCRAALGDIDDLPFLAIESDGSPFPQLIEAKLETFCLRARRLHQRLAEIDGARGRTNNSPPP